jgi:hypothetical protein
MDYAKKQKRSVDGKDKNYEMDRKFPTLPLDVLEMSHLTLLARRYDVSHGPDTSKEDLIKALKLKQDERRAAEVDEEKRRRMEATGAAPGAELGPMARSTRQRDSEDIALTEDEGQEADALDAEFAPFIEGILANLVDEEHQFIKTARELEMPLKAGISGTTHRFMNQASMMGADLYGARSAILGHLVRINAHSFHEICSAARPHTEYQKGHYLPFRPFSNDEMYGIAKKVGITERDEQNILLGVTTTGKKA